MRSAPGLRDAAGAAPSSGTIAASRGEPGAVTAKAASFVFTETLSKLAGPPTVKSPKRPSTVTELKPLLTAIMPLIVMLTDDPRNVSASV